MHMRSSSNLLTSAEAATILGVSTMTVSRLNRAGEMTPVRTRPYLFERSEVERLAAQRRGVSA